MRCYRFRFNFFKVWIGEANFLNYIIWSLILLNLLDNHLGLLSQIKGNIKRMKSFDIFLRSKVRDG